MANENIKKNIHLKSTTYLSRASNNENKKWKIIIKNYF